MTIAITIVCTALWMWFGAKSHYYWENKRKRDTGNMNQTWQKYQVRELLESMFYGPGAFMAGRHIYKNEMKQRN